MTDTSPATIKTGDLAGLRSCTLLDRKETPKTLSVHFLFPSHSMGPALLQICLAPGTLWEFDAPSLSNASRPMKKDI